MATPDPPSPAKRTTAPWIRVVLRLGDLQRSLLAYIFLLIGRRAAYAVTAVLARVLYYLLDDVRVLGESQCAAALRRIDAPAIARQAFIHRCWNMTDLVLAQWLLSPGRYTAVGGRIPPTKLQHIREAQQAARPLIFLSAYYGPYDLLPILLGLNGVRAAAVYRPHGNPRFDRLRQRVRSLGGCPLVPVHDAAIRLPAVLDQGGAVALIADHHADEEGMPVEFLGVPTRALRSVGLLAWRYDATVIVAGIHRCREPFRFQWRVADSIDPADWAAADDAVACITDRYLRALERIIDADPAQYAWHFPRWGEAHARQLLDRQLR